MTAEQLAYKCYFEDQAQTSGEIVKSMARCAKAYAQSLRDELERAKRYEALYAEARESLCSCNHTDTPEKGPLYNYTCDWCETHPDGAEPPLVIKQLWEAQAELERVRSERDKLKAGKDERNA